MALNEEEQMDVVFKSQRSQEVDPVSGNEVPPGSLPEEVRDDIPAMLSEGEYVVPADVLRYYGVKFFEDLRTEAKMGLSDMEANGRIGGEPIAAQGSQDADALTPEEMAVLQEMGMAVGGLVPQPTQSNTPNLQQQQMYPQAAPVAMGNVGYNEGGLQDSPATAFDTSQYGRGFLIDQARGVTPGFSATPKLEVVTMYGPNGEIEAVTLPTQQNRYDELVALGYSRDQVAVTTETDVGREEPEGRETRSTDSDKDTTPVSQMDAVQLAEAKSNALSPAAKATLGVIGAITGLPVGLAGLADKMSQKSIESRAEELGINLSTVTKGEDLNRSNFVSDDAFNNAMESVAPTGMSYDRDTGSYTRSDDSLAPSVSARPQARPGTADSPSASSGSKGLGQSVAEALGFDSFGDMFDGGGKGASAADAGDSNDNDNDGDYGGQAGAR